MESSSIILIRHGETEWNRKGLIQGHSDSPLTELGRQQAKAVGRALREEKIDALICSFAGRAKETARLIGEAIEHTAIPIEGIHERGFGELQGLTMKEAGERFGQDVPYRMYHEPEFNDFSIESQSAFRDRVVSAINNTARAYAGKTVVVISHGGALNIIFKQTIGLALGAPRRYELRNCSINRIQVSEEQWTLSSWGDGNHLKQFSLDETTA